MRTRPLSRLAVGPRSRAGRKAGYIAIGGGAVDWTLDGYLQSLSSRLYLDFTKVSTTWQDTAATTPADDIGEAIGRVDDKITGTSSPNNAIQATGSLSPLRQSTGAKFDGTDDNLRSTFSANLGSNFIVALCTFPASVASTQVAGGVGTSDRFGFGIRTNGLLHAGIGGLSSGVGAEDLRGTRAVVAISNDGATARAFVNALAVYDQAQTGLVSVTAPYRIGSGNSEGDSAFAYFSGSIERLVAGPDFIDLARYLQIRNALLAA